MTETVVWVIKKDKVMIRAKSKNTVPYSNAADSKVAPKQKEVTSRMAAETLKKKKEVHKNFSLLFNIIQLHLF